MTQIGLASGHPWLLFYTERTPKTLPLKSNLKYRIGAPGLKSDGNRIHGGSPSEGLSPLSSSDSCKSEDQDDFGLVDALATAISHVRISGPKRSKLCGTGPIEQQGSSNMQANNLCKAF